MQRVFVLVGISLSIVAQAGAANRTDRETDGLKGPAGSVRVEIAKLSAEAQGIVEGKRVRGEKRVYDDKGNLTWQITYASDSVFSTRFYSYSSAGTQLEIAHVRRSASPGSTGPAGFTTIRFTWTHKDDGLGNRIESVSRNDNGVVVRRLEYSYDKGARLSVVTSYGQNGALVEKCSYETTGEIKQCYIFDAVGSIVQQNSYSYEYDGQKNWIKRVTARHQNGKSVPAEVAYRTITYYPPLGDFQMNGGAIPGVLARSASSQQSELSGQAMIRVESVYPMTARAAHISGDVVVEVTVDEEGDVLSARAVSGHPLLKEVALNAAWDWKFSPMIYQGRPVKVIGTIEFHFRI